MRKLIAILPFFLCFSFFLKGQQVQPVVEDFHKEKIGFFADWWQNPAMRFYFPIEQFTDVSVNFSEKDHKAFATQEGADSNGFLFRANSFFKDRKQLYYGKATYSKINKENYKWNTVADVNLLQPYIVADTTGGKMYAEHYFFAGGYARRFAKINIGAFASYRAATAYKKKDPRPNNTVSDLRFNLGTAWTMSSKYTLGFDFDLNKYQQDQGIKIYQEGGGAALFYLRGLGVADERFSTVITDKSGVGNKYKKHTYGLNLTLFPVARNGFLVTFSGIKEHLRLLKYRGSLLQDVSALKTQELKSAVGYKFRVKNADWLVKAYGQYKEQKGKEYIYRQNGTLLSTTEKYKKENYVGGLESLLTYKWESIYTITQFEVSYTNTKEQYAGLKEITSSIKKKADMTFNLQENLLWNFEKSSLLVKIGTSYRHSLSKTLKTGILTAKGAKETLLTPDYLFETSNYIAGQLGLRYDYKLTEKYSIYGKTVCQYARYKEIGNRKEYKLSIGMAF